MSTLILSTGYEDAVRARLAVRKSELPDDVINQPTILTVSEATIARKVPNYAEITDPVSRVFLEGAVVAYICYKLCPTMANRIKTDVTTLDVKWRKSRVDWIKFANELLQESEELLQELSDDGGHTIQLFTIAKANEGGN